MEYFRVTLIHIAPASNNLVHRASFCSTKRTWSIIALDTCDCTFRRLVAKQLLNIGGVLLQPGRVMRYWLWFHHLWGTFSTNCSIWNIILPLITTSKKTSLQLRLYLSFQCLSLPRLILLSLPSLILYVNPSTFWKCGAATRTQNMAYRYRISKTALRYFPELSFSNTSSIISRCCTFRP